MSTPDKTLTPQGIIAASEAISAAQASCQHDSWQVQTANLCGRDYQSWRCPKCGLIRIKIDRELDSPFDLGKAESQIFNDAKDARIAELERQLGDAQTQEAVHREFAEGWVKRIAELEAALARRDALLRAAANDSALSGAMIARIYTELHTPTSRFSQDDR